MEEFDSVTGDYDFDARRFDATNNQFIQPDSVIQNVYDPQSLNHYSFERNNPYKYEDETGESISQLPTNVILGFANMIEGSIFVVKYGILANKANDANFEELRNQYIIQSFEEAGETFANSVSIANAGVEAAYGFDSNYFNEINFLELASVTDDPNDWDVLEKYFNLKQQKYQENLYLLQQQETLSKSLDLSIAIDTLEGKVSEIIEGSGNFNEHYNEEKGMCII